MYNLHRPTSVHLINTVIFASSCIFGFALSAFQAFPPHTYSGGFQPTLLIITLVEAGRDIFAIYIVQRGYCQLLSTIQAFHNITEYDSMVQGISTSLASTFLSICFMIWFSHVTPSTFIGCIIAIAACVIYSHSFWRTLDEKREITIQVYILN